MNNFPSSYKVPKWLNLDEEVGGVRGHILCYYFNDIHFEKIVFAHCNAQKCCLRSV